MSSVVNKLFMLNVVIPNVIMFSVVALVNLLSGSQKGHKAVSYLPNKVAMGI